MNNYESLVEKAFSTGSPLPFSNESARHARVVMKHIFKHAKDEVNLYSSQLPSVVKPAAIEEGDVPVYSWDELVQSAKDYLDKSTKTRLKIKVKNSFREDNQNGFITLSKAYPDQVSIEWGKGGETPDFMVNDTGGFRFEYQEHQAIACANNTETGTKLRSVFEAI